MENTTKGLAFLNKFISVVDTITTITNENNITQNTTEKNNIKTQENPNIKRVEETKERVINNNSTITIHGDLNITMGSININVNNTGGAYHKSSSSNLGYTSPDDYWIQENERYNKAVTRFYKSNF